MFEKKKLNVHARCTVFSRVRKGNGSWILLPIIVMPVLVTTRRIKCANELYKKNDGQLLADGRGYVIKIGLASSTFSTPLPALMDVTSQLDDFEAKINNAAATGD